MRSKLRKLLTAWGIWLVGLTALYCFAFIITSIPVVFAQGAGRVTGVVRHAKQNYAALDNGLEIAVGRNRQLVQAGDRIEKSSFTFSYSVNGAHINVLPHEAVALFLIMSPAIVGFMFIGSLILICSKDFRSAKPLSPGNPLSRRG
jgi:hypothetical protein